MSKSAVTSDEARKRMMLDHLDSVFLGRAWHGAALLPTIRAFDLAHALMENEEGYSPWKIVLHCAYWKFDVRRLLTLSGEKLTFPRRPRDFPRLPEKTDEASWRVDIGLLEEQHSLLRQAAEAFPPDRLDELPPKGRFSFGGYILGAAAHDVYHTAHLRNLGVVAF